MINIARWFARSFGAVLFLSLVLSGCELYGAIGGDGANIPGGLPELLQGEWVYIPPGSTVPSERYVITGTAIQYGYGGGGSTTDYRGDIRFVSNYDSASGIIIIEYTQQPAYPSYNGLPFFGIYYRNLKGDTVQLANAINPDYSAPDTATLQEAVEKFTRLAMGYYVGWGHVMPQRRISR
jgi:hypothetical protein